MKRLVLLAWMLIGIIGSASAQRDDLYFVPKKKVKAEAQDPALQESPLEKDVNHDKPVSATPVEEGRGGATLVLEMDEDAYNRRGSYLTEQGDAVSEFAMNDEGFVLITEDGDTMWMNTDTLRLSRVTDGEGWVNGFDGSDSDYEYAMRIIRFRNPRYAIPVSSPLYWDVVYGGALWPSWDWNIYDDGIYAYVFPTTSNWYYWDYRMSYPFGWSAWGSPWSYHYGCHWGHHWGYYAGYHYGHMWYDPWFNPYFHDYYPGWHHAHHHHGHYPHWGNHGWGGGAPKAYPNHRTPTYASSRRDSQGSSAPDRGDVRSASSSRTGSTAGRVSTDGTRRIDNGSERNSSVRVVTGNSGSMRSSGSSRVGSDEALRRGTGSSSANRSTYTGNASRSSYTSQGTSRSSGSTSSYSRSSSTRVSSSSSMSRSSSSSSGSSRSSYSSGSSSYSSGSSRSSYSSGSSSYSSGSSSRSSYSGGGSYSSGGGSSRSSGSRR